MSETDYAKSLLADALRLDLSRIPDDASMKTLRQWDSLAHMELIALAEERLSVTLSMDDIVCMASLEGLAAVLAAHGKAVA
ncbi:MAG: acyl carrier protein [Sulfuritalea sp.]|nr:acyl carrier protein [Sulfuritalea sp.]